jgi:hypothetical protein
MVTPGVTLEGVLARELNNTITVVIIRVAEFGTGWTRACSLAGARSVGQNAILIEVQLGVVVPRSERQQRVIQEVEAGGAQFHVLVFRDGELLEQRNVAVPELGHGDIREP